VYGESNGHMTDDVKGEVLIVTSVIGMFGQDRGSLEKSHGIGQTSCSCERYLVLDKISKIMTYHTHFYH